MKRITLALAIGVAVIATLVVANVASAHAPIVSITWDADTNPTTLTASTNQRGMESTPGSFYLRVYNAGGSRVDNGDAKVSADTYSITVTLQPNLPAGPYRVDWLTTSMDGAVLSSSVPVPLPGGITLPDDDDDDEEPAAAATPTVAPPVAPPSTGNGGLVGQQSGGVSTSAALAAVAAVVAATGSLAIVSRRR